MNFYPHNYQDYAIRYIEKHPVAAVLLDMGLGKTIISLTAVYDLLFDSFEVHRVLVVAPLRVARDTWPAEIQKWKQSPIRRDMILADRYYQGDHDILHTPRTAINEKGELEPVKNLPDNRIVDNQYQKAVDQKKNYLLSKPFTVTTQNDQYTSALKDIMDKRFLRTLKRVAGDSISGGIGYLYPYYNEQGQLQFKRFNNYEIIPFWADEEHTELDCFGRLYQMDGYEGENGKDL